MANRFKKTIVILAVLCGVAVLLFTYRDRLEPYLLRSKIKGGNSLAIFEYFNYKMAQTFLAKYRISCVGAANAISSVGNKTDSVYCESNPSQSGTLPKVVFGWKMKDLSKSTYVSMMANSLLFWKTGVKDIKYEPGALTCQTGSDFVDKSGMQGMVTDCSLVWEKQAYPLSFFFFYPTNKSGITQVISVVEWRATSTEAIAQVRSIAREAGSGVGALPNNETMSFVEKAYAGGGGGGGGGGGDSPADPADSSPPPSDTGVTSSAPPAGTPGSVSSNSGPGSGDNAGPGPCYECWCVGNCPVTPSPEASPSPSPEVCSWCGCPGYAACPSPTTPTPEPVTPTSSCTSCGCPGYGPCSPYGQYSCSTSVSDAGNGCVNITTSCTDGSYDNSVSCPTPSPSGGGGGADSGSSPSPSPSPSPTPISSGSRGSSSCSASPAPGPQFVTGITTGNVWGTNSGNGYMTDSSLGKVATHAGLVGPGEVDYIAALQLGNKSSFSSTAGAYDITSMSYPSTWCGMTVDYGTPPGEPVARTTAVPATDVLLTLTPKTLSEAGLSTIFFVITNPTTQCKLRASPYVTNDPVNQAARNADATRITNLLNAKNTRTDVNDPYNGVYTGGRRISKALSIPDPVTNDGKARGKKAVLVNYSTVFEASCDGYSTKKVQIVKLTKEKEI